MIVLDASALVEVLLGTPAGATVREHWRAAGSAHAPHLATIEATHVLRRLASGSAITDERAGDALDDLRVLPVERHPHDPLLSRVWELRHDLSAYDGLYVSLAEILDAPLFTLDARLAGAPGTRARIELITR